MEAYHTFLHEQRMLQNKLEYREKNRLISIKKVFDEAEEKAKNGMVRKLKAKVVTYRWKVCCPGCGKWSFLNSFKKEGDIYFCPKSDCFYEIAKDRIWNFGNNSN